jgi:hypothetical protein
MSAWWDHETEDLVESVRARFGPSAVTVAILTAVSDAVRVHGHPSEGQPGAGMTAADLSEAIKTSLRALLLKTH